MQSTAHLRFGSKDLRHLPGNPKAIGWCVLVLLTAVTCYYKGLSTAITSYYKGLSTAVTCYYKAYCSNYNGCHHAFGYAVCLAVLDWWPSIAGHSFCCIVRVAGVLGRCAMTSTSTKQDVEPPILRHKAAYQTPQSRIYQALEQHVLRHGAAYIKQESSLSNDIEPDILSLGAACIKTQSRLY